MKNKYKSLKEFLVSHVQEGRNSFCFDEVYTYHGGSRASVRQSLYRLVKAKELFSPKHDFFVIVPPEHQNRGSVSSLWFIDAYMRGISCPYYVGLLSAAALLGAGHQQPQVLQVLAQKQLTPIQKREAHVQFYTSPVIDTQFLISHKTPYGYVGVSSPALTVMDLFRFPHASGYLNNMATVIIELADQIHIRDLKKVMERQPSKIPHVQRLGYMSETLGLSKIAEVCESFVLKQKHLNGVSLNPHLKNGEGDLDPKWKLIINDTIETDL